jgi:hypothetical protein
LAGVLLLKTLLPPYNIIGGGGCYPVSPKKTMERIAPLQMGEEETRGGGQERVRPGEEVPLVKEEEG